MLMILNRLILLLMVVVPLATSAAAEEKPGLPPLAGPVEPRVEPEKGDDGLYHQRWFVQSFLDLKDDHA
ncbi:MAG: hypothetical protein JSS20_21160, partial [Proteobacteria bacterium]|nr:hypothetical protein [Pseudomonadota bacterium]